MSRAYSSEELGGEEAKDTLPSVGLIDSSVGPLASRPVGDVGGHSFISKDEAQVRQTPDTGAAAPLTEAGYQSVAALCCEIEMETFIRRVIFQRNDDICDEASLHGLVVWYDCVSDSKTFAELEEELTKAHSGDCPWLGDLPNCPARTNCLDTPNPFAHRRRTHCVRATTPPPGVTTQEPVTMISTTGGDGCQGGTQDIVVAIDASKSVENVGWNAEAKFGGELVNAITAKGNPSGHQISVYWFNEDVMAVPGAGKAPNQVGSWSNDGAMLQSEILKLSYPSIRAGSTDHPQVFVTAGDVWKAPGARPSAAGKTLVLITDGETHSGLDCPKEADRAAVEAEIGYGPCTHNEKHPCEPRGCDMKKCMCGLYKASLFKKTGARLIIAGVKNLHHVSSTEGGVFERQMQVMASPNSAFVADNFEDLDKIVEQVVGSVCI